MRTLRVFNCTTSFSDQRALSKSMFSGTRPLCEPSVYLIVLLLFPTSVRFPSLCFLALSPYRSCTPFGYLVSLHSQDLSKGLALWSHQNGFPCHSSHHANPPMNYL